MQLHTITIRITLVVALIAAPVTTLHSQSIPSPEEILGFVPGTDSLLADWSQIEGYLEALAESSTRVRLDTIGRTTLDKPLYMLEITSAENHRRIDDILAVQKQIADPRRLTPTERDQAIAGQPAVVMINNNIHSTEIGSSLFAIELAHRLANRDDYGTMLDSLVVLIIPSTNPDGLDKVVQWYREYKGTNFESGPLPWLYHPYAGHDNNRDWFMLTQPETRAVTRVLYHQWFPEVVWDVHQMGQNQARFFLPPYGGPINPNLDPMLVSATNMVGATMGAAMRDSGLTGIAHGMAFDLWWHGGFRTVPARHNMIGILSEAASARLASPVYIAPEAERARTRSLLRPSRWPGGEWGIGDIVHYQLTAADALLELMYDQRERFVRRFITLGERAIRDGTNESPRAFVIPPAQRDNDANRRLQQLLLDSGVDLDVTTAPFSANGESYSIGTVIVRMDQPFRAHVKDLLEIQHYPSESDGTPVRPFDTAAWTLPLQMGLNVAAINEPFDVRSENLQTPAVDGGGVEGVGPYIVLRNSSNAESRATAEALQSGTEVWTLADPLVVEDAVLPEGSLVLHGGAADSIVENLASEFSFTAYRTEVLSRPERVISRLSRIGVFVDHTANIDEGWTRWVLDENGIPFSSVDVGRIRAGDLSAEFDVIILPSADTVKLLDGPANGSVPEQFSGGIGAIGVARLGEFLEHGGVIVALGGASRFAITQFMLPAEDLISTEFQRKGSRFSAFGSIFGVSVEGNTAISSGIGDSLSVFFRDGAAFSTGNGMQVTAKYVEDPLQSGYASDVNVIAGAGALVNIPVGNGRVILFGFRPQHRGQTLGTFKLLFNSILLSELL